MTTNVLIPFSLFSLRVDVSLPGHAKPGLDNPVYQKPVDEIKIDDVDEVGIVVTL
jgi:hypothetical protein